MDEAKLTPWFDVDVKPTRPGVYEKEFEFGNGPQYQYWDGVRWFYGAGTPTETFDRAAIRDGVQPRPRRWRGLLKGPK